MLKKNTKVGILGGGLTGLTISANLRLANEVLEKESECGGLCRSYKAKGFTFDFGGSHIIYSRNARVLEYIKRLLGANCHKKKKVQKIYFAGSLVNYPFENNLPELWRGKDEEDFDPSCSYAKTYYARPRNLKEWLCNMFGREVAERYLIPYNRKIWKYPLERMEFRWAETRLPNPLQKNSLAASYFYYPLRGGIQTLIDSLKHKTRGRVETRFRIKKIIRNSDKWIVSDGQKEKIFDILVSTIPIFDLIACIDKVPATVKAALQGLKYNSLVTVIIGTQQKKTPDFITVYFPQKEFLFHRLAFPGAYSHHNVPRDKFAIIAEITASAGNGLSRLSDRQILRKVVADLQGLGIIDKHKICYQKVKRIKYAYVIPDKNHRNNIKLIKDFVKEYGIWLCGRFAEFEYLNMDACMERALRVADKLNRT